MVVACTFDQGAFNWRMSATLSARGYAQALATATTHEPSVEVRFDVRLEFAVSALANGARASALDARPVSISRHAHVNSPSPCGW